LPDTLPRLIVERCPGAGERVRLPAAEASHVRARRLAPGDAVILLDGSGAEARGRLVRLDRGQAEIEVDDVVVWRAPASTILLAAAGLRSERLSWMAEKATELGAGRFVFLDTARTQTHRAAPGLADRLARVVREAAKQSQSARWPSVEGPWTLDELFSRVTTGGRILLDESGDPFPRDIAHDGIALAVGPEGGWTDGELALARERGWSVHALPAGRLRAETAAVAALTLARAALEARPGKRET
jgi:16S rRNA (uracil1498-N3)-methyltransferase